MALFSAVGKFPLHKVKLFGILWTLLGAEVSDGGAGVRNAPLLKALHAFPCMNTSQLNNIQHEAKLAVVLKHLLELIIPLHCQR